MNWMGLFFLARLFLEWSCTWEEKEEEEDDRGLEKWNNGRINALQNQMPLQYVDLVRV